MTTETAVASIGFLVATCCAALMGFAIQRGATCTVAAVDEVLTRRRFQRLVSMGEASLWVVGGLLLANAFSMLGVMPAGYAVTAMTFAGGALLGLGAFVNRACVFGAIARLGSGEWAYVATPLGFYAGCASLAFVQRLAAPPRLDRGSPVLQASGWVAALVGAALLARACLALRAAPGDEERSAWQRLRAALGMRIWSPHAATIVIGITFVVMLLLVGAWAYTDVLAELAQGMSKNLVAGLLLLAALFAGAVAGGLSAGRFRHTRITFGQLLRCFVGGAMMGWGSALIPGSNDGLILIGIPLLWPYAWVAFAVMCVTIAVAMLIEQAFTRSAEGKLPLSG